MNSLMQQQGQLLTMTLALRDQLLDLVSDEDLGFSVSGNPTLGALCKELGEYEHMYAESFTTCAFDGSYRHPDAALASSVSALKTWFAELDGSLRAALEAIPEADLYGKMVQRPGFELPLAAQYHVFRECLLIFYGKVMVYLRAMNKPLPEQWVQWIG